MNKPDPDKQISVDSGLLNRFFMVPCLDRGTNQSGFMSIPESLSTKVLMRCHHLFAPPESSEGSWRALPEKCHKPKSWLSYSDNLLQIFGPYSLMITSSQMSAFFHQSSLFSEAAQLTEIRFLEEQAHDHFQRLVQRKVAKPPLPPVVTVWPLAAEPRDPELGNKRFKKMNDWMSVLHCPLHLWKVLQAWREATMCAVSKRHQQGEAAVDAQRSINQGKTFECSSWVIGLFSLVLQIYFVYSILYFSAVAAVVQAPEKKSLWHPSWVDIDGKSQTAPRVQAPAQGDGSLEKPSATVP